MGDKFGDSVDEPRVEEALLDMVQSEIAEVRTVVPGKIVNYDHAEQRAEVKIKVRSQYRDPDTGERETYLPPSIPDCPVNFPQGNGYAITWPLKKGDPVELRVASRSLEKWLGTGTDDVDPDDPRRFDVNDMIVDPGVRSFANALSSDKRDSGAMVIAGQEIHLGKANPSEWVAIAKKVEDRLQAIEDYVAKHEHYYTQPSMPAGPNSTQKSLGGGTNASSTEDPNAPSTSHGDTESSKVKSE